MIDHRTAEMIDGSVHEIVGRIFQGLELAMINWIVGSMLGSRNQNSYCAPI
jgi:hypothetical protein